MYVGVSGQNHRPASSTSIWASSAGPCLSHRRPVRICTGRENDRIRVMSPADVQSTNPASGEDSTELTAIEANHACPVP